jgi:rhamnulokinase
VSLRVAFDLGAGSGRAFLGRLGAGEVVLEEVHRFHYDPRLDHGRLRWDAARLFDGLDEGLRRAAERAAVRGEPLASVGVDAWGVDYGLIDARGRLLEDPVCYRDPRTRGTIERVLALVPRAEIFERTGIQFLELNTLYQLFAHRDTLPAGASRLLMIPDLCHHHLCGSETGELTIASTTQLLDRRAGRWDDGLFARLGLPRGLMPDLVPAGTRLGRLRPERAGATGAGPLEVIAPATHDTASAVAGTPLAPGWAYVSSGTWSLVGVERDAPLVGEDVARANFTNEWGAGGTVRFLRNVMGLWLLESCRREWRAAAGDDDVASLLRAAGAVDEVAGLVYPDDPRFFNPPSMVRELGAALAETGQRSTEDPVLLTRVVLDSLALRYASVVETLERLTGRPVPGVHIVGGGSRNECLDQATADASGRPVVAGPAEATAAGNLLLQSLAAGALGSWAEGRRLLAEALPPRRFEPRGGRRWEAARTRYRELEGAASLG